MRRLVRKSGASTSSGLSERTSASPQDTASEPVSLLPVNRSSFVFVGPMRRSVRCVPAHSKHLSFSHLSLCSHLQSQIGQEASPFEMSLQIVRTLFFSLKQSALHFRAAALGCLLAAPMTNLRLRIRLYLPRQG